MVEVLVMVPEPVRLYNPNGPDRVAVVSVEPSSADEDAYLIRVGRGAQSTHLTGGTTYGPYDEEELEPLFIEAVEMLRGEGFQPSGLHALLTALQSSDAGTRARAAARLGWRRETEAVDALLAALPNAVDDTCALLDALGAIGDTKAITVLREYASRKLLSRRRSAVEALRNLDDEEGLDEARQRALERLPDSLCSLLDTLGEEEATASVDRLVQAVKGLDAQTSGLALDTLYELATPLPVAAVRRLLGQTRFDRPHVWRYVKSVFKRSMLRHDYETFGLLAHEIEAQGRTTTGTTAIVKSGYDGVQRQSSIFRQRTQFYLRRLAWRYLRLLARHRAKTYPYAAAAAIIPYSPKDAEKAQDLLGPYASCYLLHRVAFGESKRFVLDNWRLAFRYANARAMRSIPDNREEKYPELWDAEPRAYLRVLGAARLPEAHVFAVQALSTERLRLAVLQTADHEEVLALLHAPYEPTVELGLHELDRRFDPDHPDWSLLELVLADERPLVSDMGKRWVRRTAPVWTRDADRIVTFLGAANSDMRALVIELARAALHQLPEVRQQLALRLLTLLRRPESAPGAHEGYGQLARLALLDEMGAVLSLEDIMALVTAGSPSAQAVGGELLARRPEAVGELGLERLVAMASADVAHVRAAAHHLIRSAAEELKRDPSPLFVLVESEWPDTRNLAFDLLRTVVHPEALGLDGVTGLIDSNRLDVQAVGCDLVQQHFESLPAEELIYRLAEHPHPALRPFTIELIVNHLPAGPGPFERVQEFFRGGLYDLWPSRQVKRALIDFLGVRGLKDERQAKVAAGLLQELLHVQGRADFERALEALVRLKIAYPELETNIRLRQEGLA
jgi:hypothetical protein